MRLLNSRRRPVRFLPRGPAVVVVLVVACGGSNFSSEKGGDAGNGGNPMTTGGTAGDETTGGTAGSTSSGGRSSGGSAGVPGASGSGGVTSTGGASGAGGSATGGVAGSGGNVVSPSDASTTDTEGLPVSLDELQTLCEAYAAHATSCMWLDVPNVDWNCGEAGGVWNATAFRTFATCVTELPCDGDGQTCVMVAIEAAPTTAVAHQYSEACTTKYTECGYGAAIIEGACVKSAMYLYTDEYLSRFIDCFTKPCDQITPCFESSG